MIWDAIAIISCIALGVILGMAIQCAFDWKFFWKDSPRYGRTRREVTFMEYGSVNYRRIQEVEERINNDIRSRVGFAGKISTEEIAEIVRHELDIPVYGSERYSYAELTDHEIYKC